MWLPGSAFLSDCVWTALEEKWEEEGEEEGEEKEGGTALE